MSIQTDYILSDPPEYDPILSATTVNLITADPTATTLYTVPVGKTLILTRVSMVATGDSHLSVVTVGRVGALTDFVGSQTLTNLAAEGDVAHLSPIIHATVPVAQKSYAAGTIIQMNVTTGTAATGGAKVFLFGILY